MYEDFGKLVLRLTLGMLMLFHGIAKLRNGVGGIEGMLESHGVSGLLAYGAFVGELFAPFLLLVGLYTRVAAIFIALHMIVAVGLAHMSQLADFAKTGGWALELQGFFFFTAIAVFLIGPGKYSIDRR